MLLDANLLLYAVHRGAEQHEAAATWLTEQLNGPRRVAIPWQSLPAFVRISTHPRAYDRPLDGPTAWELVTAWLDAPVAWIPQPGPKYPSLLGELISAYDVRGNLIPDAMRRARDRARPHALLRRHRLRPLPRTPLGEPAQLKTSRHWTWRLRSCLVQGPARPRRSAAAGAHAAGGACELLRLL
jgi:predicted nucleic acid-binding protein